MGIKGMKVKTVSVRKRGAAHMWAEIYPEDNFSVLCELGTQEKRLMVPSVEIEDLRRVADNFRHFEEYHAKLRDAGVKAMPDFKFEIEPVSTVGNGLPSKPAPIPAKKIIKRVANSNSNKTLLKSRKSVRL